MKLTKIKSFRKDFESRIRSVAIEGTSNINSELTKRGQQATVSYTLNQNKIQFTVVPITQKLEEDKLPKKEAHILKKTLGPVPIEMLNQEMSQQSFSTTGIEKALEKTQETLRKKIDSLIKNIL